MRLPELGASSSWHVLLVGQLAVARLPVAARNAELIVLGADVLHQVDPRRRQPGRELQLHRPRPRSWILEGEIEVERPVVDARPPFNRMELLGVWCPARIEPELVVVADGIDDERIAVPPADGVAPPRRERVRRMRTTVHVNDTVRSCVTGFMQQID